jgi:hypothetical protein
MEEESSGSLATEPIPAEKQALLHPCIFVDILNHERTAREGISATVAGV